MTPGLCLDSGEFIPASELNMTHFETKRPKEHTPVMSITEENEKLAKRISFLEGLIHTCSTGCTKAGCVNRVLQQRIAELTESLETASSAVIVLKQQQREGWAQLASGQEPRAWETFDGEGGYDFRQFDENETYREDWIQRNGEKYASWVVPLYAHPAPTGISQADCLWARNGNTPCTSSPAQQPLSDADKSPA